ncbi:hypothetical protein EV385_1386 [Krasilnikovia cinnamomea]|uniref:WD40 repeat protein n=2 Tax=Krasilnikovia cinnamomea TaxID=349313 RepID=A0A4Q7ZHE4_9ACTN|nr:hypothetical protein EV385_1386 [Krasilnikovia cinnamomea]
MVGAASAHAMPAPVAADVKAAPAKKLCKVEDTRLTELSGLVATTNGFITVNDSTDRETQKKVFYLDQTCKVTNAVPYSGKGPLDTEDMALSRDRKTLWIGDTGDNDKKRATIALWKMPATGSKSPTLYRLKYPDGAHDAEGLLLDGDGIPIVVTKDAGKAGLYKPAAALKADSADGVPLRRVGEVTLPSSDTANPLGPVGRLVATGAAVSPDGTKVVIRTYADAFEWDVTGGDMVAALKGTPRQTPLPNEPFGEAISYTPDGKAYVTVSDMGQFSADTANFLLRYTPATQVVSAGAKAKTPQDSASPAWYSELSLKDLTYMVGGVGALGALLVGLGVSGIMRSRKKPALEPVSPAPAAAAPKPADAETELLSVGGPAAAPLSARPPGVGPVYGANRGGPPPGGGVYGTKPHSPAPSRGGVYSGGPSAGAAPGGHPGPAQGRPGHPAGQPPRGQQLGGHPRGPQSGGPQPGGAQPGGQHPRGPQPNGQHPGRPPAGPPGPPSGRPMSPAGRPAPPPGPGAGPPGRAGGGQPARPGGGVYGAPPAGPPPGSRPGDNPLPNGWFGSDDGPPDDDRPPGTGRPYDPPGYGR